MDTIKKTYKLTSDKQRTFIYYGPSGVKEVEFRIRTIYEATGTYSTRDRRIQEYLESRPSFGRDFVLVEEVDVADTIRPKDEEVPVFLNDKTDAMEFPNFNAAKKYAVDTFGVEGKDVRTLNLLTDFLSSKGVSFTIKD